MTTTANPAVWPILTYTDAPSAIAFLQQAFGFISTATHTNPQNQKIIEHAELRWPGGGGVMLGSAGKDDSEFGTRPAGTAAVYVVTQEPDALFVRATVAGAQVVRGLTDEDYGSRSFSVRDPEGNLWDFGTYGGE